MSNPIQSPRQPQTTHTQGEAAARCGVSQTVLANRGKKRGWLSKLNYCFPGQFWELVAVGNLSEPSAVRLTTRGVEELNELIQNCSPEPPTLDANKQPIRENGAVLKERLPCPKMTLQQYAEAVWWLHQFDGAGEHERLKEQQARSQNPEKNSQATIEAELIDSGEIVSVSGSSGGAIERVFEALECMDRDFWSELERRQQAGKLQGRLLKAVELQARTEGEIELESEYLERVKTIAQKRKSS